MDSWVGFEKRRGKRKCVDENKTYRDLFEEEKKKIVYNSFKCLLILSFGYFRISSPHTHTLSMLKSYAISQASVLLSPSEILRLFKTTFITHTQRKRENKKGCNGLPVHLSKLPSLFPFPSPLLPFSRRKRKQKFVGMQP